VQPLKEDTCQPVKQRSKSRKQILSILYPTKFRSTLRTARQYHSSALRAAIDTAVAESKKRDWKMNVAVVDPGGHLVAFQRMDGAMLAAIQIAEHKARAAATFRRETKVFEDGINLMHLNYLLAFDGVIASRGGIPLIEKGSIIGAIGVSGGTDSQDEIVSKAGAAVINEPPASNK